MCYWMQVCACHGLSSIFCFLEALKTQNHVFTGTGKNGLILNPFLKMMGQILLFRSSTVKNVSLQYILSLTNVGTRLHVLDNIF